MSQKQKKLFKKVIYYIGNTLIAIVFVSPLLWMFASAFKPEGDIFSNLNSLSTFIPKTWTTENFSEVFKRVPMLKYIMNSVGYCFVLIILDLVVNSLCGYALAKFHFPFQNVLLILILALMVMPTEAIIMPLYSVVASWGWLDQWIALIVPFVAKCFSIYMFRQFFLDIPDELIEAAAIDGCSPVRTFVAVVVPISGPVYATVFILDFVAHWNEFMWPMMVMTSGDNRTVQLGIQAFFGTKPVMYGPVMASLIISAIPMIIIFVFLQKYYVQGIASTGIKG